MESKEATATPVVSAIAVENENDLTLSEVKSLLASLGSSLENKADNSELVKLMATAQRLVQKLEQKASTVISYDNYKEELLKENMLKFITKFQQKFADNKPHIAIVWGSTIFNVDLKGWTLVKTKNNTIKFIKKVVGNVFYEGLRIVPIDNSSLELRPCVQRADSEYKEI